MGVAFSDIYDIVRDVRLDYEYRILVAANVETLSLAYGIELRAVMLSHYLAVRIILVTGLLYMLSAASVRLGLESDVICHRLRQQHELLVRKSLHLVHIERT